MAHVLNLQTIVPAEMAPAAAADCPSILSIHICCPESNLSVVMCS